MTHSLATACRGARPLAFLACALLALCTASCAFNKHLLPLGFELSEKRWKTTGPETVSLLWINEEYHAVVSSTTRLGEQTATYYYTQGTPSDGSTGTPPQLIDQPGRIPDWFDPNLPPAGQG